MPAEIPLLLAGLVTGSFLNVVIGRLPKGESLLRPGSHCPKCGKSVHWYDNIPLISYLLLSGRCRACREPISWRYPAVELVSAVLWLGMWKWAGGGTPLFGTGVIFLSLLLVAAVSDLETGLIPNGINFFGLGAGLLISGFYPALHTQGKWLPSIFESFWGILAGGGLVYLTGMAGSWIFQRELARLGEEESMGAGDVKLMAMAGAFLGWQEVLLAFFLAPFLALPFALFRLWAKKEEIIPYGPFLALALAVLFLWGDELWRLILFGGFKP